MVLVDSSMWIRWFRGEPIKRPDPKQVEQFAICPPILQEVLQGFKDTPTYGAIRSEFLALPMLADPVASGVFLEAAEIYRLGRRKGFVIRSSVDCLIAAIAIRESIAVMHVDRDFEVIAKFTGLRHIRAY